MDSNKENKVARWLLVFIIKEPCVVLKRALCGSVKNLWYKLDIFRRWTVTKKKRLQDDSLCLSYKKDILVIIAQWTWVHTSALIRLIIQFIQRVCIWIIIKENCSRRREQDTRPATEPSQSALQNYGTPYRTLCMYMYVILLPLLKLLWKHIILDSLLLCKCKWLCFNLNMHSTFGTIYLILSIFSTTFRVLFIIV